MKKKETLVLNHNGFGIRLHNRRITVIEEEDHYVIHTMRTIRKGEDISGVINLSEDHRLLETITAYSKEAMELMVYGFAQWKEWKAKNHEK